MPLDSPMLRDSDAGFVGFASRLNPLSLPPGMLQDSVNMRLDRGVAQTRKGAKRLADEVDATAVAPLALDFTLGTDQTVSASNMTFNSGNNTVTVTLTAHGFTSGQIVNIRGAVQTPYNGDYAITVSDANTFTYVITGSPVTPATGTIIVNGGPVVRSTYGAGIYAIGVYSSPNYDNAREYVVLAGGSKAYFWRDGGKSFSKDYPTAADETIDSSDEVSLLQAFDRIYVLRKAQEWGDIKQVSSLTGAAGTATVTCPLHGFADGQSVRIDGASPSGYNGTYAITLTGQDTFTYTYSGALASPATGTIIAQGATDYGPKTNGVASGAVSSISNASPAVISRTGHQLENGMAVVFSTTSALPTGITAGTLYYVINKAADTFEISATSGGTAINTSSAGSGTHTVTPVFATVVGTTATLYIKNHGYPAGSTVRVSGSSVTALDGIEYAVNSVTTHTLAITIPSGTANDTNATGRTVQRVKPPIYWDGGSGNFVRAARGIPNEGISFRRMQSVGWANYINNRVWAPDGRDSVMVSDVLDPDLFDPFFSSFRANQGSADYIVGIHGWVEGQALVFLRNSIWLAQLNDFSSTDGSSFEVDTPVSKLTLLTDEIGCVARKSIQTAGQYVYFLSDAGVYRLDSRLDLKLRGDTRPLSDPISDKLENLTAEQAERAVGKWFANRYWLSVPENLAAGTWNLFIFNALNEQWESRDLYGFTIEDLLITLYAGERRLFAGSRNGRLFLLDELESGDMSETGSTVAAVPGSITTRRYHMQDLREKRFIRILADALIPHTGGVRLVARTINPDATDTVTTQTNFSGSDEDYTINAPIRKKASYLDIIVETTAARPSVRAMTVEAAGKSRPSTDTRTRS